MDNIPESKWFFQRPFFVTTISEMDLGNVKKRRGKQKMLNRLPFPGR
jgi:hypothetical protein